MAIASVVVFTRRTGVGSGVGVGVGVSVGVGVKVGEGVKVGVGSNRSLSASIWHSLSTTDFHSLARGSYGSKLPDLDCTCQVPNF